MLGYAVAFVWPGMDEALTGWLLSMQGCTHQPVPGCWLWLLPDGLDGHGGAASGGRDCGELCHGRGDGVPLHSLLRLPLLCARLSMCPGSSRSLQTSYDVAWDECAAAV